MCFRTKERSTPKSSERKKEKEKAFKILDQTDTPHLNKRVLRPRPNRFQREEPDSEDSRCALETEFSTDSRNPDFTTRTVRSSSNSKKQTLKVSEREKNKNKSIASKVFDRFKQVFTSSDPPAREKQQSLEALVQLKIRKPREIVEARTGRTIEYSTQNELTNLDIRGHSFYCKEHQSPEKLITSTPDQISEGRSRHANTATNQSFLNSPTAPCPDFLQLSLSPIECSFSPEIVQSVNKTNSDIIAETFEERERQNERKRQKERERNIEKTMNRELPGAGRKAIAHVLSSPFCPTYDGTRNFRDFVHKFNTFGNALGLSNPERIMLLPLLLRSETAEEEYKTLDSTLKESGPWESLISSLCDKLCPTHQQNGALIQLQNITQGELSVDAYVRLMRAAALSAFSGNDPTKDKIMTATFLRGLNSKIKKDVLRADPKTLNEAILEARWEESLVSQSNDTDLLANAVQKALQLFTEQNTVNEGREMNRPLSENRASNEKFHERERPRSNWNNRWYNGNPGRNSPERAKKLRKINAPPQKIKLQQIDVQHQRRRKHRPTRKNRKSSNRCSPQAVYDSREEDPNDPTYVPSHH